MGLPALGLSALMFVLTGVYDLVLPILAVIVAMLGAGSGVAAVMSVVGVTPGVDPHRRVNASDAGENQFAIQVALHSDLLLVLPTLAMAVPLALDVSWLPSWFAPATSAVALVNAVLVGWVGGAVTARRLYTHLPETFARLRYAGTAAATARGGDGLLDYLSGQAESSAAVAAAAAKGNSAADRMKERTP